MHAGWSVGVGALLLAAGSHGTAARAVEDVRYPAGDLMLAAELLLPESAGPHAAAVVLQGSGDSDRSNAWSAAIAEQLRDLGLVVLLTDKRGCGASTGDWRTTGIDGLADDALAGVRYLLDQAEVDPDRIGLVGLSQGGWVAPVAAARSADVAFVIDVSGAAVGFAEQTTLEMANTARQAGLDDDGVRDVLSLHRAATQFLLADDFGAYQRRRLELLETDARPLVAGFPETADDPRWQFLRRMMTFDPMPYWSAVEQPVLVLYGELDEQDNVPVAESCRRLEHAFRNAQKANHRIQVIPGAGHGFVQDGQLMPAFVTALQDWIRDTVLAE